jgi:large subunit ribosomal protein L6
MSRVAKNPVEIPKGVEFSQRGSEITLKGKKGSLSLVLK